MLYIRAWSRYQDIGFIAQFSSERTSTIGASGAVLFAELNVDFVLSAQGSAKTFREIEKFPAIARDIAMIVPEKISHAEILRVIQEPKELLLESVELFDLFAGEGAAGLGPERKSLAYRLTYRDKNRTLTNEEVTAVHAKIRERLQRKLGAELRE
jgi:phenylalanyl-tRNA synthetase beta chain